MFEQRALIGCQKFVRLAVRYGSPGGQMTGIT
jgi:hypothetical protein